MGWAAACLPPVAAALSPLALVVVLAGEVLGIDRLPGCTCPGSLLLVVAACAVVAADVVILTVGRWNLADMLEAGLAWGAATAIAGTAGLTAMERAFDFRGPPVTAACMAVGLGAVSAAAMLVAVTVPKLDG